MVSDEELGIDDEVVSPSKRGCVRPTTSAMASEINHNAILKNNCKTCDSLLKKKYIFIVKISVNKFNFLKLFGVFLLYFWYFLLNLW